MVKKLERVLSDYSTEVIKADTTNSVYFSFGCIKLRVSDHFSDNSKCDLAIFRTGKLYTVIPMCGINRKIKTFTSVDSLLFWVMSFEEMVSILMKTPQVMVNTTKNLVKTSTIEGISDEDYKFLITHSWPSATKLENRAFWNLTKQVLNAPGEHIMHVKFLHSICGLSTTKRTARMTEYLKSLQEL